MAGCSGNCGSCGGCARELVLTEAELELLRSLGQIPFQPIARRIDSYSPIYLAETEKSAEECSRILELMEKKGLITLDYDKPLRGFDYKAHRICGSMALTARGQLVLEMVELQGMQEE